MACSSRISRIIPIGLPLTWESTPADFQPFPQILLPFNDAALKGNGHFNWSVSPKDTSRRFSPASPIPDFPTIMPPTTPTLKTISLESPRPRSSLPTTKQEGHRYDTSMERCENRHNAISNHSMHGRHVSLSYSRHISAVECSPRQDLLPRLRSPPALPTSPDTTWWMTDTTNARRGRSRQHEPTPSDSSGTTKTHRHRYSHVVRTDALAPSPAPRKDCKAHHPSTDPAQPWLTENHEIDWATYFRFQPLPTSPKWSRVEATFHNVEGPWTGSESIRSP
jgi:hypothetical protein